MADQFVTLNVGGVLYTTTRTTLTKYPDCMLANMFSGKHTTATDANGNYFIDRDGSLFRYVLNFLRSAQLNLPEDFKDLDQLKNEADFYQLEPLIALLTNRRNAASSKHFIYVLVECNDEITQLSLPVHAIDDYVRNHPTFQTLVQITASSVESEIIMELKNLDARHEHVEYNSPYSRGRASIWRIELR